MHRIANARATRFPSGLPSTVLATLALLILGGCAQAPADNGALIVKQDAAANGQMKYCARPVYPPKAMAERMEGTVTLAYLIGTDGAVRDTRIIRSSGHDLLDEAARSGIALCHFTPRRKGGEPIEAWVQMQYAWSLQR